MSLPNVPPDPPTDQNTETSTLKISTPPPQICQEKYVCNNLENGTINCNKSFVCSNVENNCMMGRRSVCTNLNEEGCLKYNNCCKTEETNGNFMKCLPKNDQ